MIHDYTYSATLLIDTVIQPEELTGKIVRLNTKHYDKYILTNVEATSFNSFSTINAPNNVITVEHELIPTGAITTTAGILYYAMTLGTGFQAPTTFAESAFGQMFPPAGLPSTVDYYTWSVNFFSDFIYLPVPTPHNRLSLLDSVSPIQNEPIILDYTSTGGNGSSLWQTTFGNSTDGNFQNQPISSFNFIEDGVSFWKNNSRYISCPTSGMTIRNALRQTPTATDPTGPIIDVTVYPTEYWGLYSGMTARNLSTMTGVPDFSTVPSYTSQPICGAYWYVTNAITFPSPNDTINIQFQQPGDIDPFYSYMYFYNSAGTYLYQSTCVYLEDLNFYQFSFAGYSGGGTITQGVAQFYTPYNTLIEPQYLSRITSSFFTVNTPATTITIPPGFYSTTAVVEENIYQPVIDAFAAEGVTITITYSEITGLITMTSTDSNTKLIKFTPPLNRFFGEYNQDFIEFTTNWVSPNIADYFNAGQFSCIRIHCSQLADASFQGMSDVIAQIYPTNTFGEQITSRNINLFVNFPDHINLSSLNLLVTDNNNQFINLLEPIYLIFQIYAYTKIEGHTGQGIAHRGGMRSLM